ncbi:MAG: ice-binding family protein [Patescibacteria group bacterium]
MKKLFIQVLSKLRLVPVLLALMAAPVAQAATTPNLGTATTFGVLVGIYNRNGNPAAAITGDFGYTTLSGGVGTPTVSGATHAADGVYNQAVTDRNAALATLNSQPCTFTFPAGSVNLATDTSHGPVGIYTPGVYCTAPYANVTVGTQGVTLRGGGTYIFRIGGILSTAANSVVKLADGASACDVFWTPSQGPVIPIFGFGSTFIGTNIDPGTVQINDNVTWVGRAIFSGTAKVASNFKITTPSSCTPPQSPDLLRVVKKVINDDGGTAVAADFNLHVKFLGTEVTGSPAAGVSSPGRDYWLLGNTYVVSEDARAGYTATFSGDCDANGNVAVGLAPKTCMITNNDIAPPPASSAILRVIKHVVNNNGGTATASSFTLHVKGSGSMGLSDVPGSPATGVAAPGTSYTLTAGTYIVSENTSVGYTATFSGDCDASGNITLASSNNKTCTITNDDIAPYIPPTPGLATLRVIKHVVNNNGGAATASSFTLHVKGSSGMGVTDVAGSPAAGVAAPGTSYSLVVGTYVVSESPSVGYNATFSGDCDDNGNITLASSNNKTCTITNDDIAPSILGSATLHVIKVVVNDNGGTAVVSNAVVHVESSLGDVAGSPQAGAGAPGTSYTLIPGIYNVSENFFPRYTVRIAGDCGENGNVTLASGDDKTCTITNNDIAEIITTITTPPITVTPPTTPSTCDICSKLTYDVYIINPNGTQRHTGTAWVRVTDRGNAIRRYSFEDATLDPHNPLYDYNDTVIDVDLKDCKSVNFMFVSSDAAWKHKIRIKVSIDGVTQSDTLVADDSKAVVGTSKIVNATTGVKTALVCKQICTKSARDTQSAALKAAQDTFNASNKTDKDAYNVAVKITVALQDKTARKNALTTANSTWKAAKAKALSDWNATKKAIQNKYKTSLTVCRAAK